MASTNKTTNLELSQYVSSDKPTYLVDYNSDMSKIDTGVHTAQVTADTASTAATNAQTTAEGAQTTANTAITNAATADGKAVQAQNDIGTLANLTTTAKTNLVSAINEVDEDLGNLVVNSSSQLTNKTYSCSYVNTHLQDIDQVGVEQLTNKVFIDSNGVTHPVYRKVIEFNLGNTDTTNTPTGITNAVIFDFEGYARLSSTDNEVKMLPFKSEYAQTGDVDFGVNYDASNVRVQTFTNRTGGYGWAILEYYKTN